MVMAIVIIIIITIITIVTIITTATIIITTITIIITIITTITIIVIIVFQCGSRRGAECSHFAKASLRGGAGGPEGRIALRLPRAQLARRVGLSRKIYLWEPSYGSSTCCGVETVKA